MRVLLIGDEKKAPYHPLGNIVRGVYLALQDTCELTVTTAYKSFSLEKLQQYDCVISYIDTYQEQEGYDSVLAEYVMQGGHLLALHNGVITLPDSVLEAAFGGRFEGHPPYTDLIWVFCGQEAGSMPEEPYMVRPLDEKHELFLQFSCEGKLYPAGWVRRYKSGTVAYLAPGHDGRTGEHPLFHHMLRQTMDRLMQY